MVQLSLPSRAPARALRSKTGVHEAAVAKRATTRDLREGMMIRLSTEASEGVSCFSKISKRV